MFIVPLSFLAHSTFYDFFLKPLFSQFCTILGPLFLQNVVPNCYSLMEPHTGINIFNPGFNEVDRTVPLGFFLCVPIAFISDVNLLRAETVLKYLFFPSSLPCSGCGRFRDEACGYLSWISDLFWYRGV